MPTTRYIDADGRQVPSVTTVLKTISKPALENWIDRTACDRTRAAIRASMQQRIAQALEPSVLGKALLRCCDEALVPDRWQNTDAADAGTLAHAMIENVLKGRDMCFGLADMLAGLEEPVVKKAYKAVESFDRWRDQTQFEPEVSEVSLVSDVHRFGGTIDYVGTFKAHKRRERGVLDFKTGKGIYRDSLPQVGAYAHLWQHGVLNDRFAAAPAGFGEPVDGIYVLRLGKEHANFSHNSFPDTVRDLAWTAFKTCLDLTRLMDELGTILG